MAIIRRTPGHDDFRHMNRMMDRFFGDFWSDSPFRTVTEAVQADTWAPVVDIQEDDNAFHIHAELPGLTQDDIRVNVENNQLLLEGERKLEQSSESTDDAGRKVHRTERSYGKFYRAFRLPESVDRTKIDANMANGVLSIVLPKSEETLPKQIEVKVKHA